MVPATSWKKASRGGTNDVQMTKMMYKLLELQGGGKASEIQKGAEGIGRKCRKQRERLEEYFDGIMVGIRNEHRIQIYQKTTYNDFTTHETQ